MTRIRDPLAGLVIEAIKLAVIAMIATWFTPFLLIILALAQLIFSIGGFRFAANKHRIVERANTYYKGAILNEEKIPDYRSLKLAAVDIINGDYLPAQFAFFSAIFIQFIFVTVTLQHLLFGFSKMSLMIDLVISVIGWFLFFASKEESPEKFATDFILNFKPQFYIVSSVLSLLLISFTTMFYLSENSFLDTYLMQFPNLLLTEFRNEH